MTYWWEQSTTKLLRPLKWATFWETKQSGPLQSSPSWPPLSPNKASSFAASQRESGAKAQNSLRGRGRKGLPKSIRKTWTKSSKLWCRLKGREGKKGSGNGKQYCPPRRFSLLLSAILALSEWWGYLGHRSTNVEFWPRDLKPFFNFERFKNNRWSKLKTPKTLESSIFYRNHRAR